MKLRALRDVLVAVVVVFVALVAGGVVLAMMALTQTDVVHQIILAGMGSALVASGLVLVLVEVFSHARERAEAASRVSDSARQ